MSLEFYAVPFIFIQVLSGHLRFSGRVAENILNKKLWEANEM
jgi:hypothetical protein